MVSPEQIMKEQAPRKIRKIHFLIHPGFLTALMGQEKAHLINKYEQNLEMLSDDELVVIILHPDRDRLKSHFTGDDKEERPEYNRERETMLRMREIIHRFGPRAITLSGSTTVDASGLFKADHAIHEIRRIANARGFTFDTDTITEAYGELLGACLDRGAENLNKTGGFTTPTVLNSLLTDYGSFSDGKGAVIKNLEDHKKSKDGHHLRIE